MDIPIAEWGSELRREPHSARGTVPPRANDYDIADDQGIAIGGDAGGPGIGNPPSGVFAAIIRPGEVVVAGTDRDPPGRLQQRQAGRSD